jgi:hypothetical protein
VPVRDHAACTAEANSGNSVTSPVTKTIQAFRRRQQLYQLRTVLNVSSGGGIEHLAPLRVEVLTSRTAYHSNGK